MLYKNFSPMINNIRIILVNPSHPGNIGASARAMKNMGLQHLYLVNPKKFPNAKATAQAAGADDLLSRATITTSLTDALLGSKIIFGTSARLRALSLRTLDPKCAAQIITKKASTNQIAILFGRESSGLSNEELAMCNYHIHIPTNPNFSSLNIAQAVQLIAYEIKIAQKKHIKPTNTKIELATIEEIQNFYQHLQKILLAVKFLNPKNEISVMAKLKRLFNRAQLEKNEVSILRGILTTINTGVDIKK